MAESSDVEITPAELFVSMPKYFQADKAGATSATVQFELSGDGGGQWWMKIAEGRVEIDAGTIENPNLTLLADAGDYVKITLGKMDPTMAFMQGKVKINGDTLLAMKLPALFKRP